MSEPSRVVILGAGPAGVGAAYRLATFGTSNVTVLEKDETVGGLAGSFSLAGLTVDFGSHRLHPACDPMILADIRALLGDDLLDRPRHGRIRLRGRWIHFPLKPLDLALRLPPGFALGVGGDMVRRAWPTARARGQEESFASVLQRGLGGTICRDFYFPYAHKIWGLPPEELAAIQARRRVRAGSLGAMARKIASAVPGLKPAGSGRFYYPRTGFGSIPERYFEAARDRGAEFRLGAEVTAVHLASEAACRVEFRLAGGTMTVEAGHVWSTIPVTTLVHALQPAAPSEVLEAAGRIRYRSMILIYLVLAQERFTEYDAHYFPEPDVPVTRMSEPRNYSTVTEPRDRTVLCAELPCSTEDSWWSMPDADLGQLVQDALALLGIPVRSRVLGVVTRRLPQAYPIYDTGYETHFEAIDAWLSGLAPILTFGRQGLFAHDNTHHALAMGYAAADCLDAEGRFDRARWAQYRTQFATYVVED